MRPRIVLHGALGSAASLQQAWKKHPAFERAWFWTLKGHGNRSGEVWDGSMGELVRDLRHSLDSCGEEEVEIIGYSMGGFVALELAATGDERIRSLTTLGSKFAWDPESAARETDRLDPAILREKVPAYLDSLRAEHGGGWETLLENTRKLMTSLGKAEGFNRELLKKVFIPVTVCRAENDRMVDEASSREIAAGLPAGTYQNIPNSQHPPERVDLDAFAQLAGL